VESPSLEIFQPRLDAVLCSLLWVTLLGQGVGLGDPQRALPTLTMLGFCDFPLDLKCSQQKPQLVTVLWKKADRESPEKKKKTPLEKL